jgi:hypothetical protein
LRGGLIISPPIPPQDAVDGKGQAMARNRDAGPAWLCIGLGLAMIAGFLLWYRAEAGLQREARDWPTTAGIVIEAQVVPVSGRGGRSYAPVARYRYQVAGRSYRSDRIWFAGQGQTWRDADEAAAFLEPYAPGTAVTVTYDPDDPSTAILLHSPHPWPILLGLPAGLAFLVPGVVILARLRRRR